MYRIRKTFKFEASHQLYNLPKDHPCASLHGHSYKIEIFLESDELDRRGFVVDFGELKSFKESFIDYPHGVDHSFLNEKIIDIAINQSQHEGPYRDYFKNISKRYSGVIEGRFNTSAENLSEFFYKIIRPRFPWVVMVRVHETETGYAEYWEDEDDEFSNNFDSYGDSEGEIIEDFVLQEL